MAVGVRLEKGLRIRLSAIGSSLESENYERSERGSVKKEVKEEVSKNYVSQ